MADTGYKPTTATGETSNDWLNASNVFVDDTNFAQTSINGDEQDYYDFDFTIPEGTTIDGIEVYADGFDGFGLGTQGYALSWDGGSTYTSQKQTSDWTASRSVITIGNSSDTWGRTWDDGEFSNGNFRLLIERVGFPFEFYFLQVKVFYTSGGTDFTETLSESFGITDSLSSQVEFKVLLADLQNITDDLTDTLSELERVISKIYKLGLIPFDNKLIARSKPIKLGDTDFDNKLISKDKSTKLKTDKGGIIKI